MWRDHLSIISKSNIYIIFCSLLSVNSNDHSIDGESKLTYNGITQLISNSSFKTVLALLLEDTIDNKFIPFLFHVLG